MRQTPWNTWTGVGRKAAISIAQLLLQESVHHRRVPLALHLAHHLADEEADEVLLSALVLSHLVGAGGDDLVDGGGDGAFVGDLGEALVADHLRRLRAAPEPLLQDLLGAWPADHPLVQY